MDKMEIELDDRQVKILEIIVNKYQSSESPVTGKEIADAVGRHPGTIRKETQSLQAFDLIEGITGPKGGYKPTVEAYRVLDHQSFDTPENLTRTQLVGVHTGRHALNSPKFCCIGQINLESPNGPFDSTRPSIPVARHYYSIDILPDNPALCWQTVVSQPLSLDYL